MPPKTRTTSSARKGRRKEKKNVAHGNAYIKSTFNNTIVSITDPTGAVIAWASSGQVGFKGSRKSTPFAAQLAASAASCAAKGVDLREPLKPTWPDEAQAITAPVGSVMDTMVLLKVDFCLLYTSDAADDLLCVDLGGRRIIK